VSTDSKAAEGRLLIDGQLSPSQLRDITAMYYQERLCLLQSLEDLLWLGEGAAGEGPFGEAVEETLVSLLAASPGLEETTVDSLREILESTADSKSPCSFSGPLQDEATPEVNALLAILMLIYFHPRKQCTPARCLELAHMFHVFIFTQPQYLDWGQTDAQAGGEILLSVKLVCDITVLLYCTLVNRVNILPACTTATMSFMLVYFQLRVVVFLLVYSFIIIFAGGLAASGSAVSRH